ncbi:MAG: FAD-binding oxidoreductase [Patescibacteria group bacterium]|nr:MAG: FAD-binding oxidoreductase [Patescibacteria group bacterium]
MKPLDQNLRTDVVIVGGGIAGVTTAFFTLLETQKNVVLLDADKVAHGATGHNAGQVTSYFERPLHELADQFGLEAAVNAQRDIESAWALIDQMVAHGKLRTPLHRFVGHAGLSSLDQLVEHLKNNQCRKRGGLATEHVLVAEEWNERAGISAEFDGLYEVVPQADILARLETSNPQYIASLSYQKGCMNSALFSEEVVGYLLAAYQDRFALYEGSPVKTVYVSKDSAELVVNGKIVRAENVVLCTNGFENFSIINRAGNDIDTSFHHSVVGRIGYMAGYYAPPGEAPMAISYFSKAKVDARDPIGESYFYLTRRPHEHESGRAHTLVCTGGPEAVLPNGAEYSRAQACAEDTKIAIDDFLSTNYAKHPGQEAEYAFCWHGLMGYTPEGVRLIGPEPLNPVLLYNLGCNGVGILPSVFGGKRISRFLNGERLEPSLFDPRKQAGRKPPVKKAQMFVSVLAIALGMFLVVYGGLDDSPGGQMLGLVLAILGMIGGAKSRI